MNIAIFKIDVLAVTEGSGALSGEMVPEKAVAAMLVGHVGEWVRQVQYRQKIRQRTPEDVAIVCDTFPDLHRGKCNRGRQRRPMPKA